MNPSPPPQPQQRWRGSISSFLDAHHPVMFVGVLVLVFLSFVIFLVIRGNTVIEVRDLEGLRCPPPTGAVAPLYPNRIYPPACQLLQPQRDCCPLQRATFQRRFLTNDSPSEVLAFYDAAIRSVRTGRHAFQRVHVPDDPRTVQYRAGPGFYQHTITIRVDRGFLTAVSIIEAEQTLDPLPSMPTYNRPYQD